MRSIKGKRSARALMLCALLCLTTLFCALAELLLPEATGDKVYKKSGTTIDASHADQGYVMIKQKATKKKLKVRISRGDYNLTYDLNPDGDYEVFPLQLGEGKYKVQVYSQVSGTKYSAVSSQSFSVKLTDKKLPYLYPNQYVDYTASTLALTKAQELCAGLDTDLEKCEAVYNYVVKNVIYDYVRAATVKSGYIPDLDEVYQKNKGICFDIASLMACMLRSQGVPTRLMIGYADTTYHAWNEVWLNGDWQRYDATAAICANKVLTYTIERYY